MLRASYQAALNGTNPVLTQPGIRKLSKEKLAMILHDHIAYCFDHVLQGIICAGELAVESATEVPAAWLEGVSEDLVRENYGEVTPMVLDGWGTKHLCSSLDEAWNGRWRIGSLAILVWCCRVICSISCSVFNSPVFLELCMCTSAFIGCQRLASIEAVLGTSVFLHTRAPTSSPQTKFDTKYTIAIEDRRERSECFDVWAQG